MYKNANFALYTAKFIPSQNTMKQLVVVTGRIGSFKLHAVLVSL